MPQNSSIDVLNRLLTILHRSLPMYLNEASPWTQHGDQQASAALSQIVADQQRDCRRLADLVLERYGRLETGEFPMEFTDLHFLSMDFLVGELVRYQQQDIEAIEQCVSRLAGDAKAQTLAQEILGAARAHLEMLEALTSTPAAS